MAVVLFTDEAVQFTESSIEFVKAQGAARNAWIDVLCKTPMTMPLRRNHKGTQSNSSGLPGLGINFQSLAVTGCPLITLVCG